MATMTALMRRDDLHMNSGVRDLQNGMLDKHNTPGEARNSHADFPRSASYTFMPHVPQNLAYSRPSPVPITLRGSFSEADLIGSSDASTDASPQGSPGWATPVEEDAKVPSDSAHDLIAELHKNSKISLYQQTANQDVVEIPPPEEENAVAADSQRAIPATRRERPTSASLAKRLSRRLSAYGSPPSTRSPSPKRDIVKGDIDVGAEKMGQEDNQDGQEHEGAPPPPPAGSFSDKRERRRSLLRKRDSTKERSESRPGLLSRRGTVLKAKNPKPPTPNSRASMDTAKVTPAVPSFPKSFSTDQLNTEERARITTQQERPVPMPRLTSTEKHAGLSPLALPRKKDELWSVFRSLDGDYTKFQSKSSALKANVVRGSLLPFLRNYLDHPSTFALRAEDLDRRAVILNKWWTALLEMLHGRNNQSISGTDRPAILDGIAGIMERPEWRLSPSPFCPLSRRNQDGTSRRTKSSTSLSSSGTDFLVESVYHNVRNMFVQNLNAQMAFVVERMSLRNASASLVSFCGKATAFAFFFCPGIAEVLARLWDTPTETMRRVLESHGIGRFDNLSETSTRIAAEFPPPVHQLAFVSLGKMLKHLRTQAPLPVGTANMQWYGFWLERWLGRESDLFYAFVKNYHILVMDYLPPDSNNKERMCVPGLLLVHAQILANLDSTVHRDASQSPAELSLPSPGFDDILADPDAVASTIPLPPTNAIRVMAENRLIMLIRDFLSERATEHPDARRMFAESFDVLLQACAKRISIYNQSACYTLCDFMEEGMRIMIRYDQITPQCGTLIKLQFWLDVFAKMMSSENTSTQIRLLGFVYTLWATFTVDDKRKAELCLNFLLDEEVFAHTFMHWCPMVRAYYMRLLCWRLGRFDGDTEHSIVDTHIYETLLKRLRTVWSYYLWQKQEADRTQTLPPCTTPCQPAPGRRLIIIRTDTQMVPGGSFLSFDGLISPHPAAPMNSPQLAWKRHSTLSPVVELDSRPTSPSSSESSPEVEKEGGIRGFLRNMLGTSKPRQKPQTRASRVASVSSNASSPSRSPPNGMDRCATDDGRGSRGSSKTTPSVTRDPSPVRFRNFSFKFSLETSNKNHHATAMRLVSPRLPLPAHLHLQTACAELNSPVHMPQAVEPTGLAKRQATYAGRALAEWTCVVMECQSFFERRKSEGIPSNKHVETPTMGVESLSRRG